MKRLLLLALLLMPAWLRAETIRYVPLGDQALGALDRLSRRPNFTSSDDYVFASVAGDRLDPSALRRRYVATRNAAGLPPDVEIGAGWEACLASIVRPAAQERIKALMERGFDKPGDAENRLGYYVGQLGR